MNEQLQTALQHWGTASREQEREHWGEYSCAHDICRTLEAWRDDHPGWNPGITQEQIEQDAQALWDWNNA